ncbi:MAG: DoxX family protein [Candidatus Omnitrophota bacterium]|jgi:putative oxidoreductase
MCKIVTDTKNDYAALVLRLMLGIVFFAHGAQKALGWFGGGGFFNTMNTFTQQMHIPYIFALSAIAAEFLGSIALIIGFFTRIASLFIAVVMFVVIWMIHWQNGFFMNWYGVQKGEGIEYHLLVIAICIALMIKGGGSFSIDKRISK